MPRRLAEASVLLVAALMFGAFALTTSRFASTGNVLNLAKQMSIIGVLGTGMTFVVLGGGIDLSVGSVVLLSGAIAGALLTEGFSAMSAIVCALAGGALVGGVNGLLIERLRISPVIVTLGTMVAVRGLGLVLLQHYASWIDVSNPVFDALGTGSVAGVPASAAVMLVLGLAGAATLRLTRFGRELYAVGTNAAAARLCGVEVPLVRLATYILSGTAAGTAGLLSIVRTGVVSPSIGIGLEFSAISVVVLGGARLSGGVGRIERTLLGTAILVMVLNELTLRGVPGTWQTTVTGGLILTAVLADRLVRRSRA
jgi:ribose/xylose/arabinose/galactoside ABC-type transport system permease subunit